MVVVIISCTTDIGVALYDIGVALYDNLAYPMSHGTRTRCKAVAWVLLTKYWN